MASHISRDLGRSSASATGMLAVLFRPSISRFTIRSVRKTTSMPQGARIPRDRLIPKEGIVSGTLASENEVKLPERANDEKQDDEIEA